ncbi:competence type IV pilus minor pilin ComGF [Domibacillus antri]|uniref:competence type IV pilus minor pilin ComGF n=1 Tax=Domibacillus antri TaxID=1714264 RepID=UPI00130164C4|nr:competence type IV pilus minor pilin ComGF [Domibacillus antri]
MEALIALTIFLACAASFPLLYDAGYRAIATSKAEKNIEWEIFIIQLRNELHMSKNWYISGGALYYGEEDAKISISQYQDKLRRQINGQGHEVMLQHVKTSAFSLEGGKVYIHVTFQNGEEEGASFYPFNRETPS